MGPPLDGVVDPGAGINSGLRGQKHRICKHNIISVSSETKAISG